MKKIKSHVLNKLANNEQVLNGVRVRRLWEHTSTQTSLLSPPPPPLGYHFIFAAKSGSRLIQAMYMTSLGCLCPKPASFEIFFICLYVCM